jgi:hypothetical protein
MRHWVILVPADRYQEELLFRRDHISLPVLDAGLVSGDLAVLVADVSPPVVFGWGRLSGSQVRYDRRLLDAPVPAGDLRPGPLDGAAFAEIERAAGRPARRATWMVSVDLPIEAESPAEAVRQFWSYVRELGPRELPAFVSPIGDELAMSAYVLGGETNLDPEEGG